MTDGIGCNVPAEVGTQAFEIMAPRDTTALTITYARPLYAPGWEILRDGVQVLSESSNRGSAELPEVVSYDYVLSNEVSDITTTTTTAATTTNSIGMTPTRISTIDTATV